MHALKEAWNFLLSSFKEVGFDILSSLLGWLMVLFVILLLFLVIYFILKKMGHGVKLPGGTAVSWNVQFTSSDPQRQTGDVTSQAPAEAGDLQQFLLGSQAAREADLVGGLLQNVASTRIEQAPAVVHSVSAEAMRIARQMLQQGDDLDVVCRTINPHYADMGRLGQQVFRSVLEAALKSPPPSQ